MVFRGRGGRTGGGRTRRRRSVTYTVRFEGRTAKVRFDPTSTPSDDKLRTAQRELDDVLGVTVITNYDSRDHSLTIRFKGHFEESIVLSHIQAALESCFGQRIPLRVDGFATPRGQRPH